MIHDEHSGYTAVKDVRDALSYLSRETRKAQQRNNYRKSKPSVSVRVLAIDEQLGNARQQLMWLRKTTQLIIKLEKSYAGVQRPQNKMAGRNRLR